MKTKIYYIFTCILAVPAVLNMMLMSLLCMDWVMPLDRPTLLRRIILGASHNAEKIMFWLDFLSLLFVLLVIPALMLIARNGVTHEDLDRLRKELYDQKIKNDAKLQDSLKDNAIVQQRMLDVIKHYEGRRFEE